jgi:Na+/H+ antiporter NhaD/arsenite permease-like protein
LVGAGYFFFYFRSMRSDVNRLPPERIMSWTPSLLLLAMIGGLALFSSLSTRGGIHPASGVFVLVLASLGLVWLAWIREEPMEALNLVRHLDWGTLVFLVGIFVVVGTLSESGALEALAEALAQSIGGNLLLGFVIIVGISLLISGFVDNVPYIAAMLPVVSGLARTMQVAPELLLFSLLIGSCIGGNLTPFGASANIVAVSLSKKQGSSVGFGQWLKIAGPFTVATTVAASAFVWFVWA